MHMILTPRVVMVTDRNAPDIYTACRHPNRKTYELVVWLARFCSAVLNNGCLCIVYNARAVLAIVNEVRK